MKLRGIKKTKLESAIKKHFTGYDFDNKAPQGQNSFSCNYLLKRNDKLFLLKVLVREKIKGQVDKEQALSEASVYKTVKSHYVLPLLEIKEDNDYIFLLFPFLEGKNLGEYLEGRIFNEDEIVEIGISILRGIADLWRKKIVHQDLKPENIFIETNGSIKILDFGSARFQISPFRGAARRNFAYSSPEQILASRPSNVERLHITIDDRIDIYVVGLIFYRLIEGKHPFGDFDPPAEAILDGKTIPPFTRTDISDGLKKVVMRMLDTSQLNRPNIQAAINYLETGNVIATELQNSGFYYCAIHDTNRFLKIKEGLPGLFDGVVVEASQVPTDKIKRIEIRKDIKTVLIDPQFYLFQCPKHRSSKFKKLAYFKYEYLFQDIPDLLEKVKNEDAAIVSLIGDIIEYQLDAGATALIPPFLYIDEFNSDIWSIDQEITHLSLENLKRYKSVKPFVKGVAIAQGILTSDRSRSRILEYLTSLSDRVEGYMVLLDSSHSEVVVDEPWLRGAQDLFTKLLSTGRYVIWSRADFSGLVLAPTGVSIAMGEMLKQRRFNIAEERQAYGRRVPYFYIPSLFARATWPDALRAFNAYEKLDALLCSENCCSSVNFSSPQEREESDLAKHMMCATSKQFKKYRGGNGKRALREDIKKAKQHYESLKSHGNLIIKEGLRKNIKPSSSSFLDNWLDSLDRQ